MRCGFSAEVWAYPGPRVTYKELKAALFLAVHLDRLVLFPSSGGLWSRPGFSVMEGLC